MTTPIFNAEIAELDDLLKAERAARRSYLDHSIAREVELLAQRREYAVAADRRRTRPQQHEATPANRRQIAELQKLGANRVLANVEKSTPVLLVEYLTAAGAKGATSRQIAEFMASEKRSAVAVDRAKQRLRQQNVLSFADGIWSVPGASVKRGARTAAKA